MSWSEYAASRVKIPMVFGHEFAGDIVKIGDNVSEYKVGDRVAGETHIPCNHCYQCKTDNRHICENMKIIGVHVPGSFCDYIAIPKDCVYKIGDDVSYETGAMLEAMGVAVHGAATAEVNGKNVIIFGCGPIGLMAVGACKVWGAKKIIAIDVVDEKLAVASKMGADVVINSRAENVKNAVLEVTDHIGPDIVIDYTGNESAIIEGLSLLRKGGRCVLVGLPSKSITMDLTELIIYKEVALIGITGRRMYETWQQCEEILASDQYDISNIVGGIYPLEEYMDAFQALFNGASGKMILIP